MNNPFEIITEKLTVIESLLLKLNQPVIIEQKKEDEEDLVKISTASKITGYKSGYLYELVSKEEIPYIRRGRSIRFSKVELHAWMNAGRPSIVKETIRSLQKA